MTITDEIKEELIAIKDHGKKKQERNRAHAILLSNNGVHIDEIAKIFDVTTRSIFAWFKDFKELGVSSLQCSAGRGRKLLLNENEHKEIIEKNIVDHPHQPKKAFALTVDEIGIDMSYDTFKRFLKKNSISATNE